ncbi:hypothetical protein Nepgr_022857 [Nepenthes gracilis]|uniref:Uncharacterized protein n=1 Tax=Nepenthes gracilis TaxID=150966 RepID=A0AAD3XYJ5_NEPGR|nr:hypothetical protein Nepgr_022857 [Nepenthes gracilis]
MLMLKTLNWRSSKKALGLVWHLYGLGSPNVDGPILIWSVSIGMAEGFGAWRQLTAIPLLVVPLLEASADASSLLLLESDSWWWSGATNLRSRL